MNEARKLQDQQPGFMALENDEKDIETRNTNKHKKYWFDTTVLITWIILIAITIVFWIVILKLL